MNTRAFVASLVGSIVWPTVVVIVLLIFRREVVALLERPLSRLKVGPVEADWEKAESVVKENLSIHQAYRVPLTTGVGVTPPAEAAFGETESRVLEEPQALVAERWHAVEKALRDMISDHAEVPIGANAPVEFPMLLDSALRLGLLNATTVRSLDGLRHMRNLAIAGDHLDSRRAQEFAVMADAVIYAMANQPADGQK